MAEITENINWLAIAIGTTASFLLGWVWYSPKLFGKKWAEGVGLSMECKPEPPVLAMIAQLSGTFLLAWVIGITAASGALFMAILIVLTVVVLLAAGGLFSQKSSYAIITEVGFIVAMAVVMIVVQGVF